MADPHAQLPDPLDSVDPRDLGARLREARSARGWTQEQAAEALGVARTTMVAIEKGERRLKPDELIQLAKLYGRKLSALLRPGVPVEEFSVQLRGALPPEAPIDADLVPHIHELERLCDDYLELERLLRAPLLRRDPPAYSIEGIEPEQLAEDVATAERNRLGLGDAPVLNLRAVLERDVGLRIFYLGLPSKVAGMFAFTEEYGGALAINRNHPPERRRHSMAHEYGHYLTDRYRSEITLLGRYERRPPAERFAETFGRAFLMPATGLRRRYHELVRQRTLEGRGGPTPGDLCHLAHFYFVSFEAMTRRLEELGLIRSGTWQRLQQQGFRVKKARRLLGLQEHPVEDELLPSRYRYLAVEAWHRGELSEGQLASFLRVDRLSARRLVREVGLHQEGGDGEGSPDLFLPLAAAELA
jgi:Zn-dependent peptidase ImmA (M78 family)/DNA-binding XRE family transcriptional regulator